MKYVIFILGLLLIAIRCFGIEIDLISIGLFVFISIIVLLKDINHLTEFSGFGVKMKFKNELKKLKSETEKLEVETSKGETEPKELEEVDTPTDNNIRFSVANNQDFNNAVDTTMEVVKLSVEIEKTLRLLSDKMFYEDNQISIPSFKLVDRLVAEKYIEKEFLITFKRFWKIRNLVVHGMDIDISHSEAVSFIESGRQILNFLKFKLKDVG